MAYDLEPSPGRDYSSILSRIKDTLSSLLDKIGAMYAVVQSIPERMKESVQFIGERIRELMQSQIDIELLKRVAAVKSAQELRDQEFAVIEEEKQLLDDTLGGIEDRYNKIALDIDGDYGRNLRKLGAHAYDLLEKQYYERIERQVLSVDRAVKDEYSLHNRAILAFREREIEDPAAALSHGIERTLASRQEFRDSIATKVRQSEAALPKDVYQLPLWVVDYVDSKGQSRRKVFYISDVEDAEGALRRRVSPRHRYRDILALLESRNDTLASNMAWTSASHQCRQRLVQSVDKAVRDGWIDGNGDLSLGQEIRRSLEKNPFSVEDTQHAQ